MSTKNERNDVYSRVTALPTGERRAAVDETVERHTYGGQDYKAVEAQRHTVSRRERSVAVGGSGHSSGYAAPIWMTYKQATTFGAHVRKGERATVVVYADRFKRTEIDDTGSETEAEIPFLKAYSVFNVEQIEGLPQLDKQGCAVCAINANCLRLSQQASPSERRNATHRT